MLSIPSQFTLNVTAGRALSLLEDRLRAGEQLMDVELDVLIESKVGNYRRAVGRWRTETRAVLKTVLVDTQEAPSDGGSAAAVAESPPLATQVEEIKDELSREVSDLSALALRIAIENNLPTERLAASGPTGERAAWRPAEAEDDDLSQPAAGPDFDNSLVDAPAESESEAPASAGPDSPATVERSIVGEPKPVGRPGPDVIDDEAESPPVREAPVAFAPDASAALPAYDADAVADRDLIGVDRFVDAFAYLIAARNMQPPLAVGLFGHWGSGKSFLMRSIRRRVDEITRGARESDRLQAEIGVYKRVAQIEFNAWHYVEGNLWASLVDHIFSNLRTDASEVGTTLDKRREAVTRQLASTRNEQRRLDGRIKELVVIRSQNQEQIKSIRSAQEKRLKDLERLRVRDIAAVATLTSPDVNAVDSALGTLGWSLTVDGSGKPDDLSAVDARRTLHDAREVVVGATDLIGPMRQYGWRWGALLAVAALAAPVTAGLLVLLRLSVPTQVFSGLAATLSSAALIASKGSKWSGNALKQIEAAHAQVDKRVKEKADSQADEVAALQHQIDVEEAKLTEAQRDRDAAASEIAALQEQLRTLTPGKLLAEFLEERSSSGDYRKHLGITALIRRDFEELSRLVSLNNEALLRPAEVVTPGKPDFSRVVLYVDDLDRCPPERVVEVLQAVHLLLSFPVFAVVLAVDPRWLAQSLTTEYRDLLGDQASAPDGHATPDDYLEKIFQIPFSVAPLDLDARRRFIDGLLGAETAVPGPAPGASSSGHATKPPTPESIDLKSPRVSTPDDAEELAAPHAEADPNSDAAASFGSAPGDAASPFAQVAAPTRPDAPNVPNLLYTSEPVDLNPTSLRFSADELAFLRDLLPLMDASPRSLKRYINIYRLIKSVAGTNGGLTAPPGEDFRYPMLLLALQTGLHSLGPAVVRSVAEYDTGSASASNAGTLQELIGRAPAPGVKEPENERVRAWMACNPAIAQWPVGPLVAHARHVRLYAFG